MWDKVFKAGGVGVDFFFSDKPVKAMEVRNSIQASFTIK